MSGVRKTFVPLLYDPPPPPTAPGFALPRGRFYARWGPSLAIGADGAHPGLLGRLPRRSSGRFVKADRPGATDPGPNRGHRARGPKLLQPNGLTGWCSVGQCSARHRCPVGHPPGRGGAQIRPLEGSEDRLRVPPTRVYGIGRASKRPRAKPQTTKRMV